jgi:hypothetical protein
MVRMPTKVEKLILGKRATREFKLKTNPKSRSRLAADS